MGDAQLPVAERRLAEATKRAVQAAGGGKVCEDETGLSDTRISCFDVGPHPSFAAAEIEAGRLLDLMPDSTFVILQEVARVKLTPTVENGDG